MAFTDLMLKGRTFEVTQACSNCRHRQDANPFWTARRQVELARAVQLALESPEGEKAPKVVNILAMVDSIDHAVASGKLIHCTKGRTALGEQVGDLIQSSFLCDRWSAAEGASVARIPGLTEPLPEERIDKIDGSNGSDKSVSEALDRYKVT